MIDPALAVDRIGPAPLTPCSGARSESLGETVVAALSKIMGCEASTQGVSLNDFRAYMPNHNYIFLPSREPWPAASVDARLGRVPFRGSDGQMKDVSASKWLDRHRPVEQMTWAPGEPMLIPGRLIAEGGWIERPGLTCLNLYRPPTICLGSASEARAWLDHLRKIYPEDAEHLERWLAHRVQRPHEKINHAIVLGGSQGIGKDTLLEPVKRAVGPWNFNEVSPQQLLGRFNGFAKSVILRISEARDLGDVNRFQFYEHIKVYAAAPPDVIRVDEKNLREYSVLNCTGVVITTNRKDSIYLPADDRRHYVAWSDLTKDDFNQEYWNEVWRWYESGGDRHVAAYLSELDISTFNPKAPPPKTQVFWQIVETNRPPEDSELADMLEAMGDPKAVTIAAITESATRQNAASSSGVHNLPRVAHLDFCNWLEDRRNRRAIPHRMEACGYVSVHNPDRKDGLWKINGVRQAVYAQRELSPRDQYAAAVELRNAG